MQIITFERINRFEFIFLKASLSWSHTLVIFKYEFSSKIQQRDAMNDNFFQ